MKLGGRASASWDKGGNAKTSERTVRTYIKGSQHNKEYYKKRECRKRLLTLVSKAGEGNRKGGRPGTASSKGNRIKEGQAPEKWGRPGAKKRRKKKPVVGNS